MSDSYLLKSFTSVDIFLNRAFLALDLTTPGKVTVTTYFLLDDLDVVASATTEGVTMFPGGTLPALCAGRVQ